MAIKAKKLSPKNKKKEVTRVALVIDNSGSMSSVRSAALSGLNEQIQAIRKNSHLTETYVSLIKFDSVVEALYDAVPAEKLEEVTAYNPLGSTALYDAVGTAIAGLKAAPVKDDENVAYLVVVISDGEENASVEYKQNVISQEIKALEESGKWTFSFMLANQDIHKAARALNLSTGNTVAYVATSAGTHDAFATMTNSTANYLNLRSTGVTNTSNFYSPDITTNTTPDTK